MIANSEVVGEAWGEDGGEGGTAVRRYGGKGGESEFRRSAVVPNGINLDRFKPAERKFWIHNRLGIPHDHRLVGMPAVFARWKGQIEVIEAFSHIADEFPNVHLVIVGGSIYDTLA
jgi:glycosyltransferase involved in cell wall biosynthesis